MHERILVLYTSGHGDAARIARRMAALLAAGGHAPALVDVCANDGERRPEAYDAAIVCAPAPSGRHPGVVRRFLSAHRGALDAMPCAIASIDAHASCAEPPGSSDAWQHVHELVCETGCHPWLAETLAGAVSGDPERPRLAWWPLRRTQPARPDGRGAETDWAAVDRFIERFSAMLDRAAAQAAPTAVAS
jgi:menaquinone-dependent protoporphyrinogen IX oxidase